METLKLLPYLPGGQCPTCKGWLWFSHIMFNGGQPTHYECRACKLNFECDIEAWKTPVRSRVPGEDDGDL